MTARGLGYLESVHSQSFKSSVLSKSVKNKTNKKTWEEYFLIVFHGWSHLKNQTGII